MRSKIPHCDIKLSSLDLVSKGFALKKIDTNSNDKILLNSKYKIEFIKYDVTKLDYKCFQNYIREDDLILIFGFLKENDDKVYYKTMNSDFINIFDGIKQKISH